MTRPNAFFSMWGKHARVIKKVPRALIEVIKSYFRAGVSTMSCHHSAEALLIKISMRPNCFTTAATQASICLSLRRSTWKGNACTPSARTSSATVKMVPGRVGCGVTVFAAMTTWHPSLARARAHSLPMPREPPVIIATRSCRWLVLM